MGLSKAQIKRISSLGLKKYRKESGLFIAEGQKVVRELLHSKFEVELIAALDPEKWADEFPDFASKVLSTSMTDMERITQLSSPSEVLAVAYLPELQSLNSVNSKRLFYLDNLSDPGNLGAVLRIADWFSWDVVCSPETVDAFNPKVVMASMGSLFRVVPIVAGPDELINWAKNNNYSILAADMEGIDVKSFATPEKVVLVMGNEANGISQTMEQAANQVIKIAGGSSTESLNVSVSAGILAFALS